MARKQLRLEAPSIEAVKAEVFALYGPQARLVAAEKVTVGGIRGFFARSHFEVTVELPDTGSGGRSFDSVGSHRLDEPRRRAGLMALLEDAERDEAKFSKPVVPAPSVSTGSDSFAAIMDDLTFNVAPPEPLPLPPAVLAGPGDLVICAGIGSDADTAAQLLSSAVGATAVVRAGVALLAASGAAEASPRIGNRREATFVRARGVEKGEPVVVSFGLGAGPDVTEGAVRLAGLAPDQVWLSVDAGRKPEDTRAWVEVMTAAVPVAGVVVHGADATATPETVDALGLPLYSHPAPTKWDIPAVLGHPSPFGTSGAHVAGPGQAQPRGIE